MAYDLQMRRVMNKLVFALSLIVPLALHGCTSSDSGDDDFDDGKADGTALYFSCQNLGTSNTVWLDIKKTSVTATIEGSGFNKGKLTKTDDTSKTYSSWNKKVFFGAGDTLVIPDSLIEDGSGKVDWYIANVNPYWEGTCTQEDPTGDQCLPLVQQISPIDSSAAPVYAKTSSEHYTVTVPSSKVGDFLYDVDMNVDGLLCTQGDVTPKSCSAIVADKIGSQAFADGSSSGQPYVSKRTASGSGYTWTGGVHDEESGDFAYTVATDSDEDGCKVTSISANQD